MFHDERDFADKPCLGYEGIIGTVDGSTKD